MKQISHENLQPVYVRLHEWLCQFSEETSLHPQEMLCLSYLSSVCSRSLIWDDDKVWIPPPDSERKKERKTAVCLAQTGRNKLGEEPGARHGFIRIRKLYLPTKEQLGFPKPPTPQFHPVQSWQRWRTDITLLDSCDSGTGFDRVVQAVPEPLKQQMNEKVRKFSAERLLKTNDCTCTKIFCSRWILCSHAVPIGTTMRCFSTFKTAINVCFFFF